MNKKQIRINFLVLSFFLLLNFLTSGGHLYSVDDIQYFLHTENLVLNHSIQLDPNSPSASKLLSSDTLNKIEAKQYSFQGKKWSSDLPLSPFYDASSLLLPFITIPLYYLSLATSSNPVAILGFFTNSIILSIVSLLIFITGNYFFKSQKISFILSLIFLVTTHIWSYNTGMMLRPLAALVTILGFYLLITSENKNLYRTFLAGFCIGLALLAETASLIILPGMVGYGIFFLRKNKRMLALFLIGFIVVISIQVILNQDRFGSITDFGFGSQQKITTHNHIEGIIGYVFSIGWGLFFNIPLLVFFPLSVYLIWKKNKAFAILLTYCFMITWLFHGSDSSPAWSGYGGWGPRYFTIILPLLILSLGFTLKEFFNKNLFKVGLLALASFGFFINLMGKLVWYMYGYSYGWGVLKLLTIKNSWQLMNYDLHYAPITLNIFALNSGYIQNLHNMSQTLRWGLAPCPVDLYIYCTFGIPAFVAIMAALGFTGYIILHYIRKQTFEKAVDVN